MCLKDRVGENVNSVDGASPSVVDKKSRQTGSGTSLHNTITTCYHSEQKELLTKELDDRYTYDGKKR